MIDKSKSNFVILGSGRTGSTLLCNILNKQKQINCVGEIFNSKYPYYHKTNYDTLNYFFESKTENKPNLTLCDKFWGFKCPIEENMANILKYNNIEEYINIFWKQSEKPVFGYKIFDGQIINLQQNIDNYFKFLKKNNSKILFLVRSNIFLQYISTMTANNINIWSSNTDFKDSPIVYKLNPIKIDYLKYVEFKKILISLIHKRITYINNYNLPYIPVVYEHFTGEKYLKSFGKIFRFLNLDFNEFIDLRKEDGTLSGYKKINVYTLKDKIINFDDLKRDAYSYNDRELLSILDND